MKTNWKKLAGFFLYVLMLVFGLVGQQPSPAYAVNPICYVNAGVVGGLNNGTSWANAYTRHYHTLFSSPI